MKTLNSGAQTPWVQAQALPQTSYRNQANSLDLSDPQFPRLQSGHIMMMTLHMMMALHRAIGRAKSLAHDSYLVVEFCGQQRSDWGRAGPLAYF